MFDIAASLAIGFLGSLHCLGMCGPLILAYSMETRSALCGSGSSGGAVSLAGASRHLAFHAGRIFTYSVLGALAGGLVSAADLSRIYSDARNGMLIFFGVLLIALGLILLRVLPLPAFLTKLTVVSTSFIGPRLGRLIRSPDIGSGALVGAAVGLLPCCLSWVMVINAAATQDPLQGFLTMAAFGLGTTPALLALGVSSSFISARIRLLGERAAALTVVAVGIRMILKGAEIID